ncbi:hypothetical protein ACFL1G_08050, partial [Planctomycetota bacterium]
GTGTDLSTLRSSKEKLSGGGKPSGPLSFMRVYDQIAAVIKSGGKTRRAAKMQSLMVTHPDIKEFITCKTEEEKKAEPIRIIEGIDVANIAGKEAVGSLVKFIDGRPFKNGYRRFKIKSVKGIDDYAMIAEVVTRRYKYALRGEEIWPDLILIDGGRGHLNAAQKALKQMNAPPVKIASIAKKEEKVFLQGKTKPLKLPGNSPDLKLLQYVRDEAHRFAQHYFHILRKKRMLNKKS